jgi:hypothetical protein
MSSTMTDSLKVYDILTGAHLPDAQARAITQAIRDSDAAVAWDVRSLLDERLKHLATKVDLADLRAVTKADLADLRAVTKADIADLKIELKEDIANVKSELMRWMFVFWVGQMAATIAVVKLWK